ncbi:exocyst complex component 3-like protein isoform X1 [Terrapene carolina triunguis]|uniref:Exocyst complex component 3-like protein n=1 Tax=Terrapene triunguis TaxID=2587831 RepID=A0A674JMP3_9SAUR|nr:exocyst complex component 3-like protein isoform X1 [Terrapene carolina triunguis]XP_024072953.2 exocyst complex component 3-like protein isoform X1 [Terrapene carolina triunguis]
MRKMKRACCRFTGRRKLQGASSGENTSMLPKEAQKEQKSNGIARVKNMADKLLKNLSSVKEKTEEKPVDKESGGRQYLSDQAICELIDQAKFLEACNHIYDLEQSEHKSEIKIDSLYKKVAERMWSVVQEEISGGDSMLLEPLKSVGASLKWKKEKEKEWFDSVKDMESVSTWSPKYWNKDLEKLLMECMATQIPSFVSASNTDESALKDHLSQLETTIFPNLRCKRDVFKEAGLLTTYTKCCNACLSSHLSTLTDGDMSFSKCLLIYEWGFNMYRSEKLLMPHWTPQQRLLADAYVLKWIFSNVEEKLLTVTQKEVREALRQVITAGEKPYTDTTIIQVLTGRAQAVQHISDTIKDRVEAVCLEELLHFLHSYKHEVRSLLQLDTFSETYSNLQILENCCIFRAAWHKLTYIYSASADTDAKVKEFIDSTEKQSRELLLQAITSKVKVALKDHFRKDNSDFDKFLDCLRSSFSRFEMKNTETYETLIQTVHHIIVTEYVQALLTASGKSSSAKRRKIANKIEVDHRAIRTLFEECFGPRTASLDDPIESILDFILLTDIEAMKIQLVLLLLKFPDIRKEHLNIILDIKGSLNGTDRNAMLEVVYDNCVGFERGHNSFFEAIEIKPGKYGVCGCCCCCY